MSRIGSAIVAGHLCLDIIPRLDHSALNKIETQLLPGRLIEVGPATFSTGGPVSNTGLVLHRLGVPTILMGKTGADLFGQAVRQIIDAQDPYLSTGISVDESTNTSYTLIISPPGVDRIFLHCPGANDTFGVDNVDFERLREASLFHFGYPPIMRRMYRRQGAELSEIFRRARATGVTTALDMSLPDPASESGRADWGKILKSTLPYVDVFLPSIDELLYMLHREVYEICQAGEGVKQLLLKTPGLLPDLAQELLEMGVKVVAIKLGESGLYLRTGGHQAIQALGRGGPTDAAAWSNRELWAPCFKVVVVGTTGAGDATIAGFLSGLLRAMSPAEALTAAVGVGACNVEAADALSGVPSWPVVQQRILAGWERRPLDLTFAGWRWDAEAGVWIGPRDGEAVG